MAGRWARARAGKIELLLTVVSIVILRPVDASLAFQRPTDILGFASVFEEGRGLPTRNFTLSIALKSSSSIERLQLGMCDFTFYCYIDPVSRSVDVGFESTSYFFSLGNHSSEDLLQMLRTWSIVYDDAQMLLSLFVDEWCLGTVTTNLFGGVAAIFGPDGIPTLYFGVYGTYSEGVLTAGSANFALSGLWDSFQLWDRALDTTEISQLAANRNNLTGDEAGLAIYLRANHGYGSRVRNLGSSGASYDGTLGMFASGIAQTSSALGSECDAPSTTSPTWANRTATKNKPPIADDQSTWVTNHKLACAGFLFLVSQSKGCCAWLLLSGDRVGRWRSDSYNYLFPRL